MVAQPDSLWHPTVIRRVERRWDSGSEVVAVMTDAGQGFAKFLGNREGPHVLACEFLGTRLARLLGLPTFVHTVFDYDGCPEIQLYSGNKAEAGPTWITCREEGIAWSGHEHDLSLISNPDDLARLVVLDTWTLNCDRYCPAIRPPRINRNNVFFSRSGAAEGTFRLVAMDHTHILTCGRPIKADLVKVDNVKNESVFGLFPEFQKMLAHRQMAAACKALKMVPDEDIKAEVVAIPAAWLRDKTLREVLTRFLCQRKNYVAETLLDRIFPQSELPLDGV